jgi:hypothetical protein
MSEKQMTSYTSKRKKNFVITNIKLYSTAEILIMNVTMHGKLNVSDNA